MDRRLLANLYYKHKYANVLLDSYYSHADIEKMAEIDAEIKKTRSQIPDDYFYLMQRYDRLSEYGNFNLNPPTNYLSRKNISIQKALVEIEKDIEEYFLSKTTQHWVLVQM